MNRRRFLSFLGMAPLATLVTPTITITADASGFNAARNKLDRLIFRESELIEVGSSEFHAANAAWLYESHLVRIGGLSPAAARIIALRGFKAGRDLIEASGGEMA